MNPNQAVPAASNSRLARRLGIFDAVVIGLGAMIGAGIFAAVGPAAGVAGPALLVSFVIAAGVAFFNVVSVSQLAVLYPESGGAYVYGRKRLGGFWGFLAGWGFVIGKLASCTAMALTFAGYAFPEYQKPIAATAVLAMTLINYFGVQKTSRATHIIVAVVLLTLLTIIVASLWGGNLDSSRLSHPFEGASLYGIFQASGLLFFAFAGYARIATLGEEVIHPRTTIPKASFIALGLTLFLYLAVAVTALLCVDVSALAQSRAPLVTVLESGQSVALAPLVRLGAAVASLGVLLSLLAGVSRTIFAMSANRDLPKFFDAVHPKYKIPHRAELSVGAILFLLTLFFDIRGAIGFSSFAVLVYYTIANLSAWTLSKFERQWPRWMAGLGLVSCMIVAFSLPTVSVLGGLALFSLGGLVYFLSRRKFRSDA